MKFAPAAIGIVVAGAAGYFLEPLLRPSLVGRSASDVSEIADSEKIAKADVPADEPSDPSPVPAPKEELKEMPEWVTELQPEQLPEKVTLLGTAALPVPGSTEPMTLPKGASVTPVRVEGDQLVISPFGGPIEGKVAVMATDLVDVLGNKPPEPVTPGVAMVDPTVPEPAPTEPEPEPATPPVAATLDATQIVELMQTSIKGGEIKEFTFDQVLNWKAGEEEQRDGETYQTGLAAYKAETIFGVKNIQAQALIKDGKIAKWIWPKSGMEIK